MILRRAAPVALSFLAAACSVSGDWPSLGDPLPDPAARTTPYEDSTARPHQVAQPSPVEAASDSAPETAEAAATQYADVQAAFDTALKAYADARDSIAATADADIAGDRWREAQLLLTRASFVRERLIPLAAMNADAAALLASSDTLIAAERQRLERLKP